MLVLLRQPSAPPSRMPSTRPLRISTASSSHPTTRIGAAAPNRRRARTSSVCGAGRAPRPRPRHRDEHRVAHLLRFKRFGTGGSSFRPAARCDRCGVGLLPDPRHAHLFSYSRRSLLCACAACSAPYREGVIGKERSPAYRLVPSRVERIDALSLTQADWEELGIPVQIAFLLKNQRENGWRLGRGRGPSRLSQPGREYGIGHPAGGVDPPLVQLLSARATRAGRRSPARRQAPRQARYFRAPIDECYRLAGLLRSHWEGFAGGPRVGAAVDDFFAELASRAATDETDNRHA